MITNERILELWNATLQSQPFKDSATDVIAFARAIAAEQIECDAKICKDEHLVDATDCADDVAYNNAVKHCAAAIRNQVRQDEPKVEG